MLKASVTEAVLAGALVGAGEAAQVVTSAGAGSWPLVAGAAALGAIGFALFVRLVAAGGARLWARNRRTIGVPRTAVGIAALLIYGALAFVLGGRLHRAFQFNDAGPVGLMIASACAGIALVLAFGIARSTPERSTPVVALWRAALVLGAVLAFGTIVFLVAAHLHDTWRFRAPTPVGLVIAGSSAVAAVGIVLGVALLDRRIAPRLASRELSTRGWRFAAVIAALVGATLPAAIVHVTIPALDTAPAAIGGCVFTAVLVARGLRIGRHRAAQIVAVLLLVASVFGTFQLRHSPDSRGAIVAQGTLSLVVERRVWKLADHDGDRYASASVGGGDCDDGDKRRNPGAQDIPDNGIDENCTGADAHDQGTRATPPAPAPAPVHRPNIILISIDALRADHLGAYGYARKTSPALDAFAATATRFDWTFTSCPSTRCAIPSLLTGRYYSTLRARAERDVPTLAATLQAAGYQTAAITCCARFALAAKELAGFTLVDATPDTVRMQRAGQSNADVVIDDALAWMKTQDPAKPYFLWIHLYEPHYPYAAQAHPDAFGTADVDRYDAEIAYADAQLARLFAALDPSDVIAITADHGDEFGEHGIRFHARSLYNQVVRIPLIVRAPGAAPHVVTTPVSIVDVMPTLLDLAGAAAPPGMNGRSLVPALHGDPAPARPLLVELIPDAQIKRDMAAMIDPPWKVIWDREANAWSLFDLADREDTRDRASDPVLPALQKLLRETLDRETSRLR